MEKWKLVRQSLKSKKRLSILKQIAIAIICLFLMTSCHSSGVSKSVKIRENCRKTVVTWGDASDCMIILDEVQ